MTRTMSVLTILAVSSVPALAQTPAGTGVLSGAIVDEFGRPVAGAKLSYQKLTEFFPDRLGRRTIKELGFSGAVVVGADGRFTISELPSGRYALCASGTVANQVGSCDWDGVPVVVLAPGERIEYATRTVRDGTVVTLQVADPKGRIAIPDAQGIVAPERRFFIGVSSESGFYRRAELISRTPSEYVFQVTIPRQSPVRLFIDSDLTVTDAFGRQLETGRQTSQQISPGDTDQLTVALGVS